MTELQMLWAWVNARIGKVREEHGDDAGSTTLESVAITGGVVVAMIVIAAIALNKANIKF
jgi:hypothetical protein